MTAAQLWTDCVVSYGRHRVGVAHDLVHDLSSQEYVGRVLPNAAIVFRV